VSDLAVSVAGMEPADVEVFFSETEPEVLVGLIERTSDADLETLLAADHVRETAVRTVLGRLEEFAVPERLAATEGVVRFLLRQPPRTTHAHTLHFRGGRVRPVESGGEPDVVIEMRLLDFVRLLSGGANAALLHLGGRLVVRGDAMLALRVGGVFRVPGREGVAVDPAALDVAEVVRVVTGVDDGHLREVMAGGFRAVVLEEVFRRLPEFVDVERAGAHRMTIGFKITGRADGEADRYVVVLDKGVCRVHRSGDTRRDATIVTSGADFLKLVTGRLGTARGLMSGRVQVKGDPAKALTFSRVIRLPGAGE
jgi:putative sterol carrier protein